jgi:hypothetical protein
MSKSEFTANAKPLTVTIDGQTHIAEPKVFSTGSVGWNVNSKALITLPNGQTVRCQVSFNLTAIASKSWPEENPVPVAA